MDKIPTSKEQAEKYYDLMHNNYGSIDDLANFFRNFAKSHVEAALKTAAENAKTRGIDEEGTPWIQKESILNAYPLTNIK